MPELGEQIRAAILDSITKTNDLKPPPERASSRVLGEMARNSAQVILGVIELFEIEEACPLCGRCAICGSMGEDHEH